MSLFRAILAILFVAATVPIVHAQTMPMVAIVVASCGSPPGTYTPAQIKPLTQDTTGLLCNSGTGSTGTVSGSTANAALGEVYSSCGTANYTVGKNSPLTLNTFGVLC